MDAKRDGAAAPGHRPEMNRLLRALPKNELDGMRAHLKPVDLKLHDLVYEPFAPIGHVYFPTSGVFSIVKSMLDGRGLEIAMAGREGFVGVPAFLGSTEDSSRTIVQASASAYRMNTKALAAQVERGTLRSVLTRYVRAYLVLVGQSAACHALHPVERRCARWLLMTRDRVGADEFEMTQEFLATMLGVRRATVTVAAGALQRAGLITYRHGRLRVRDAKRLEQLACECYEFEKPAA
ncbi:MAG: Crp/Fnr family transcriptional regulator [Candidatus Limnocylindria bacterium]